jgi:hypothetical protein
MSAAFLLEHGGPLGLVSDMPEEGSNVALFCPECGMIWGRIIYSTTYNFYCHHKSCEKHGDGSFFLTTDAMETVTLPERLACYEARLTLLHIEVYGQYTRWSLVDNSRV